MEEVQMAEKAHEKMFTIPGQKVNANQNHTKIPPHCYYNSYHQKQHQQQMMVRMLGKRNTHTLLVGMQASTTTLENSMEASQKTKQSSVI
jgi:hypothetical protein